MRIKVGVVVLKKHQANQLNISYISGRTFSDDDLVFCKEDGKPYRPDTVTSAGIKQVRKIGFRGIRLHDARHSHASLILKQVVHPKIVQERLGHASIQITLDTYSHVTPGLQQAAAVRFDEVLATTPENEPAKKFG